MPPKKKLGRPRKKRKNVEELRNPPKPFPAKVETIPKTAAVCNGESNQVIIKKKKGRPLLKGKSTVIQQSSKTEAVVVKDIKVEKNETSPADVSPRKRGRPCKVKVDNKSDTDFVPSREITHGAKTPVAKIPVATTPSVKNHDKVRIKAHKKSDKIEASKTEKVVPPKGAPSKIVLVKKRGRPRKSIASSGEDVVSSRILNVGLKSDTPSEKVMVNHADNLSALPKTSYSSLDHLISSVTKTDFPKTDRSDSSKTADLAKIANRPKTIDLPKTVYPLETADHAKTANVLKTTDVPKTANLQKTVDLPKTVDPPKSADVLKTTDAPKTADAPKSADVPKTTDVLKTTHLPKTTEVPKTDDLPEITDSPKTVDSPKTDQSGSSSASATHKKRGRPLKKRRLLLKKRETTPFDEHIQLSASTVYSTNENEDLDAPPVKQENLTDESNMRSSLAKPTLWKNKKPAQVIEADETLQIDEALYHTDLRNKSKYSKVFKKVTLTPEECQAADNLVVCGRCEKKMTKRHYYRYHRISHYYLCWLEDEPKIDLNDDFEMNRILQSMVNPDALRKKAIRLSCERCDKVMKSVVGYVSHVRFCQKADESELLEKCQLCPRALKPSSIRHHYIKFHGVTKFAPTNDSKLIPITCTETRKITINNPNEEFIPTTMKNTLMNYERTVVQKVDILSDECFWKSLKTSYDLYMCMGLNCRHMTLGKDDLKSHILSCGATFCEFACLRCAYVTKYESEIIYHRKKKCKESSDSDENGEKKADPAQDRRVSGRVRKRKCFHDYDDGTAYDDGAAYDDDAAYDDGAADDDETADDDGTVGDNGAADDDGTAYDDGAASDAADCESDIDVRVDEVPQVDPVPQVDAVPQVDPVLQVDPVVKRKKKKKPKDGNFAITDENTESDESDCDDSEVKPKDRSKRRKADISPHKTVAESSLRNAFLHHPTSRSFDPLASTVEVRLETFATSPTLMNLRVDINEWETFPISDFLKYSPIQHKSPKVSFDGSPFVQLKVFDSDLIKGVPVCNAGGPVWSMAWAPLPAQVTEQYLAVAGLQHMNHVVNAETSVEFASIVQIWKYGSLDNISNDIHAPTLAWAVAHNYGAVWDMEWCPSGGFDNSSTPCRLGILALATSSGCCVVYSMPRLDCGGETRSIVANPEPDLVLKVRLDDVQCTRIAWKRNAVPDTIYGGFSDGTIALWNIASTSSILKKGKTLYPYRTFQAHSAGITALDVHWLDNCRFMVTSSFDRLMKFWDLEDLSGPMYEHEQVNVSVVGAWMHHWVVAAVGADYLNSVESTSFICVPRELAERRRSILNVKDTFWSVAYSDWNDAVAASSNGGCVTVFAAKHLAALTLKQPVFEKIVTQTLVVPLAEKDRIQSESVEADTGLPPTGDSYDCSSLVQNYGIQFCDRLKTKPSSESLNFQVEEGNFKSVNKVCWNQNYNSFNWLALGYDCGFVRVIRVERFDKSHLTKFYKLNENSTITLV